MPPRSPFPSEEELHAELMEQFSIGLSVCFPAKVQNYLPASQTFEAIPLVKQRIPQSDGTYTFEEIPPVPSCALLHPRGRGTFLSFPVQDGDTVLCVVLDADATAWRRGRDGSIVAPRDLRLHHIAHAVAIGGFFRFDEALQEASILAANADGLRGIVLGYDAPGGSRLLMKPDGAVEVTQGSGTTIRVAPDGSVEIGGVGLTAMINGVVVGSGIDPFTGATYGALGSASAKVLAKK